MSFICFKSDLSNTLIKDSFAERLEIKLDTHFIVDRGDRITTTVIRLELSSPEIAGDDEEEFLDFMNVSGIDPITADSLRLTVRGLALDAIEAEPEEALRGSLMLLLRVYLDEEADFVDDPSVDTFHKYEDDHNETNVTDSVYRDIPRFIILDHCRHVCVTLAIGNDWYETMVVDNDEDDDEIGTDDPLTLQAIRESLDEIRVRFRVARNSAIEFMLKESTFELERSDPEERNCVICIEDFAAEEKLASLPCRHEFHSECIVRWLKTSHVCPLCRFELPFEIVDCEVREHGHAFA